MRCAALAMGRQDRECLRQMRQKIRCVCASFAVAAIDVFEQGR